MAFSAEEKITRTWRDIDRVLFHVSIPWEVVFYPLFYPFFDAYVSEMTKWPGHDVALWLRNRDFYGHGEFYFYPLFYLP